MFAEKMVLIVTWSVKDDIDGHIGEFAVVQLKVIPNVMDIQTFTFVQPNARFLE